MKFGAGARAVAFVRLAAFVAVVLVLLGLGSVVLRTILDTDGSGSSDSAANAPTTVVDGVTVSLMQPFDCDEDADDAESCDPDSILVGNDVYVLHADPSVEVIAANVTDTVFAAGEVGDPDAGTGVETAYIVDNVDPAVLLAGSSDDGFFAITGPSIESTNADPTIDVLFVVCVSLVDADSLEQCRALAEPVADEPDGG